MFEELKALEAQGFSCSSAISTLLDSRRWDPAIDANHNLSVPANNSPSTTAI